MPHNPFIFSPTQFIRIFVIVNITTYITTKAYLDSRASSTPQPRCEGNYYNTNTAAAANPTSTRIPFGQAAAAATTTTRAEVEAAMAPKGKGENTKKVAGNARKAEAAAQKQAAANASAAAREEEKWQQGAKDTSKKQAAAVKAAEQAAKKAEREAMLAEEEKGMRDKPKGANKKTAEKKSRGTLDLAQLDDDNGAGGKERALNASGIDNALDALSLTTSSPHDMKLDRHPERRFPAAYKAYEERRLPEIDKERPGLRRNQKIELIKKEFEKSDENPFNQSGNVRYDASKEELAEVRKKVREGVENRLGEK
ncbi:putative coiled-coil domain-containing protein [Fonsecaea pedrosoi]|nr:putative coiled-coil domain-containing protein [Fonsecaea pedrosoi]